MLSRRITLLSRSNITASSSSTSAALASLSPFNWSFSRSSSTTSTTTGNKNTVSDKTKESPLAAAAAAPTTTSETTTPSSASPSTSPSSTNTIKATAATSSPSSSPTATTSSSKGSKKSASAFSSFTRDQVPTNFRAEVDAVVGKAASQSSEKSPSSLPSSSSSSSTFDQILSSKEKLKSLKVAPSGSATSSHSNTNKSIHSNISSSQKLSPASSDSAVVGAATSVAAAATKKQHQTPAILRSAQSQEVPAGTTDHKSGHLRTRSPSHTPVAASLDAKTLAHVKEINEQALHLHHHRQQQLKEQHQKEQQQKEKRSKASTPNSETGENVKGLWGIYLRNLHQRAVAVVCVSSFVLWGIGDCCSQAIEHQLRTHNVEEAVDMLESGAIQTESPRFQWGRFIGAIVDGVVVAGVGGYYWYQALDKFVTKTCLLRKGSLSFITTKMLLEFVIWHPLNLMTFWMVVGFAEGDSLRHILREFRDDFFPTLLGEYMLWGPLDVVNFCFVPVHLQVILCNVASLFESVFLSYVRSQGFPGFPAPSFDSLEDRGMPVGVIDVLRATDVSFERALRDGAERFVELDVEDKGYITAEDIVRFMKTYEAAVLDEENGKPSDIRFLPGVPCSRATEASAELLEKHARKKGQVTRREYLRFIGELNHAAYRTSLLPEVAFTLFDTTERHMITGTSLIELAHLLHDSAEGKQTVKLMMPALEALRNKELTVDEASAVLQGLDTLSKFHKGLDEDVVTV